MIRQSHQGIERIAEVPERPYDRLAKAERETLDTRFDEMKRVRIGNEELMINDLHPPEEFGKPVVFVPGYGTEGYSLKRIMLDINLLGRRVITYNKFHGIDDAELMAKYADKVNALQQLDPDADIRPQLRKAAALIATIEHSGLNNVDVFAHSEGAVVATIASYLRPDLIDRQAFLNPAGMIGEPFLGEWGMYLGKASDFAEVASQRGGRAMTEIYNGARNAFHSVVPWIVSKPDADRPFYASRDVSPRHGRSYYEEYMSKDGERLRDEFHAVTHRKLEKWLQQLPGRGKIAIGVGTLDRLFPHGTVIEHAGQAGVGKIFVIEDATHSVHLHEPEKVTEFIKRGLEIETPEPMRMAA